MTPYGFGGSAYAYTLPNVKSLLLLVPPFGSFFSLPFTVNGGVAVSEISGPFSAEDVAADCAAGGMLKEPFFWVISYALMAVCGLVLLLLLLLLVLPCRRGDRPGEITDESSLVRHRIK